MNQGYSYAFTNSAAFRFAAELLDLVRSSGILESVATVANDILNGKRAGSDDWDIPVPWSDDARRQAKYYTWENQYKNDPRFKSGERLTPFEKLLERY